mmetsp:Transcript_40053/g.72119  ORF Transcript_40053/g.72119 Transcript_40053/m.72119 type:complete len:229 (-) Transcript_40053:102-788(-)
MIVIVMRLLITRACAAHVLDDKIKGSLQTPQHNFDIRHVHVVVGHCNAQPRRVCIVDGVQGARRDEEQLPFAELAGPCCARSRRLTVARPAAEPCRQRCAGCWLEEILRRAWRHSNKARRFRGAGTRAPAHDAPLLLAQGLPHPSVSGQRVHVGCRASAWLPHVDPAKAAKHAMLLAELIAQQAFCKWHAWCKIIAEPSHSFFWSSIGPVIRIILPRAKVHGNTVISQ